MVKKRRTISSKRQNKSTISKGKTGASKQEGKDNNEDEQYINVERFGTLKTGEGRNPFYVSLVAKSRIQDGWMKWFTSIVLFPIQLYLFLKASYEYSSMSKVMFALFGNCEKTSGQIRQVHNIKTNKLKKKKKLKLVFISDTHMRHKYFNMDDFPKGDVLIHTGDASNFGTSGELKDFAIWFANVPNFKYKLYIPGNHDMLFDHEFYEVYHQEWHFNKESSSDIKKFFHSLGIITLIDESITIENLKFYGSPWTPIELPWQTGFQLPPDKMEPKWKLIEKDTDILLTHGPPYSAGDKSIFGGAKGGCKALQIYSRDKIKPILHVFGHEHGDPGVFYKTEDYEHSETYYANAGNVSEYYQLRPSPIIFTLVGGVE